MSTERSARRWRTGWTAIAALLLGTIAAAGLLVKFTWYDDPCPAFEDEGAMAAPGSPYALMMCRAAVTLEPVPMEQVELPGALLLGVGLAAIAALLLVWRRPLLTTRRPLAVALIGVLVVVPPLLVVALQYALPRDCLSGRTDTGECSRDRESR